MHGIFATRFHGVISLCDSVSSMPIVIYGYSHDFTNSKSSAATGFNNNVNSIATVGILLEIVPQSPSKRSTTIVLVLSLEPCHDLAKQLSHYLYFFSLLDLLLRMECRKEIM